jgi:hypothetical protein
MRMSAAPAIAVAKNLEELAFATVRELAELVRTRKISSVACTGMYLERLKRYDARLKFVVTLTEERALAQAKEADREIAAGKYRGPLHGLPWGAKDVLAVKGYPTTWGAGGFEKQVIEEDATVVKRLTKRAVRQNRALTTAITGLAITRNPWNPGGSGSSRSHPPPLRGWRPASARNAGITSFRPATLAALIASNV